MARTFLSHARTLVAFDRHRAKRTKKWIQKVIQRPGALRAHVERKYGRGGFDKRGRIRCEVLLALAHEPGAVGKRARLALRLRGYSGAECGLR